jgi:hypothetical protein
MARIAAVGVDRMEPRQTGRACVSDVVTARVTINDSAHGSVVFTVSESGGALGSATSGTAQLLGAANGFGTILLGALVPPRRVAEYRVADSDGNLSRFVHESPLRKSMVRCANT